MRLYNTLTRKIEEFVPYNKDLVQVYTCGPTVYHFAHIGNLRSYIQEDILVRTLEYLGYKVNRVMNITDVGHLSSDADTGDDKMVKSAIKEHKTVLDIAKFYKAKFFEDFDELLLQRPNVICNATDEIASYIEMISVLMKKGYAYQAGGNVYFDTSKLKDYYVLTNHNEKDLAVGVRDDVFEDANKRNKTDFVLWFTKSKFQDQELKWDSPFGTGYPGWHIECSCISKKYCGEYLDIHCGGVDNIFPHHTNEIAQSEAYLGHPWCKYWFHVEHLNDKNGKMSKSNGDFLTLSLLKEKGYSPLSFKFMCLQSHYRNQLTFSFDSLDNCENAYKKLKTRCLNLTSLGTLDTSAYNKYMAKFKDYLEDDLNTASALSVLYEVLKDDINDFTKRELINSFDQVLALNLLKQDVVATDKQLEDYITAKIKERAQAKQNKDYAKADTIRDELLEKGIRLVDTKDGTTYERI